MCSLLITFANAPIRATQDRTSVRDVTGVVFTEADLSAMSRVLAEVCQILPRAVGNDEREFIAWLIVRLASTGHRDETRMRAATLSALSWP